MQKDSESSIKAFHHREERSRYCQQGQAMAFSVSVSVYLLFNAMAALSEEVALNLTLAITTQPSNWTVNKTKGTEGPIALKFSHPCLEHHDSYCINGVCAFHRELKKAICRCFTGYTGERCEHLTLTSYAVNSYEKYIAIWIGVGVLLSGFLAIFYCYIRTRCLKLKSPYKVCSRGRPL